MRTHYCGQVNEKLLGQEVTVAGWVHRRRDHGGVIFVDLRDREGLLQVVFDPDAQRSVQRGRAAAQRIRRQVKGKVRARPAGTVNANLASGAGRAAGARARGAEPLRAAAVPARRAGQRGGAAAVPLPGSAARGDEPAPAPAPSHHARHARLPGRHGFIDLETPMLTKATPEGARDYLVPSRTHPGKFFALPQSPQIFKQLLMMAGFDRYYQIVRCFRDEDLRADRQPEFTQLDIETSFLAAGRHHGAHGRAGAPPLQARCWVSSCPSPFPRMTLRRGDAPLRLGQAGPAHRAGTGRCRGSGQGLRLQGVRRPGQGSARAASRRCACRAAARCRARRSTTTPPSWRATAPRAWPISRSTSARKGREGLQSPIIKFLSDEALAASSSAPAPPTAT